LSLLPACLRCPRLRRCLRIQSLPVASTSQNQYGMSALVTGGRKVHVAVNESTTTHLKPSRLDTSRATSTRLKPSRYSRRAKARPARERERERGRERKGEKKRVTGRERERNEGEKWG